MLRKLETYGNDTGRFEFFLLAKRCKIPFVEHASGANWLLQWNKDWPVQGLTSIIVAVHRCLGGNCHQLRSMIQSSRRGAVHRGKRRLPTVFGWSGNMMIIISSPQQHIYETAVHQDRVLHEFWHLIRSLVCRFFVWRKLKNCGQRGITTVASHGLGQALPRSMEGI